MSYEDTLKPVDSLVEYHLEYIRKFNPGVFDATRDMTELAWLAISHRAKTEDGFAASYRSCPSCSRRAGTLVFKHHNEYGDRETSQGVIPQLHCKECKQKSSNPK